ncbi:MAG: serine/threonine protein kinase [Deltaproteobacteria bacterium]|nr:serine/threonine protein kinase [Kofleriaceae bacterium]
MSVELSIKPGDVIAHFRIEAELGRGAKGVVFRATDRRLQRTVAVKVLAAGAVGDQTARARFVREARALAAIKHANVATVYEVGEAPAGVYIAMEHVEGETLRAVIDRGRLSIDRVVEIAGALARALAAAHDAGLIHRDVKPANVMIDREGTVKLLDFGLAKHVDPPGALESTLDEPYLMTREGGIVGTPAYMSPEQCRGLPADRRSDVFSLGIVMYELVGGRLPFIADSAPELGVAIMHDTPPPLDELNAGVPRELVRVIERCLAKAPAERYADGGRILEALAALVTPAESTVTDTRGRGSPAQRRARGGRGLWLAGVLVVGLAVLLGVTMLRPSRDRANGGARPSGNADTLPARETQLTWFEGRDFVSSVALSPDGERIAYVAGELWVREVAGSQPARVVPRPAQLQTLEVILGFFPDGQRVLIGGRNGDGPAVGALDVGDGAFELIRTGTRDAWLAPAADRFAIVGPSGISVASLTGGDDQLLTSFATGEHSYQLAWSTDGAWVAAIVARKETHDTRFVLEVYAADGSRTERLPAGALSDTSGLVWSSGRQLLYSAVDSLQSRGSELCAIGVVDGRWDGVAPVCTYRWQESFIDWMQLAAGRLVYIKNRTLSTIEAVALDAEGRAAGALTPLPGQQGRNQPTMLTPEGGVLGHRVTGEGATAMTYGRGAPSREILAERGASSSMPAVSDGALIVTRRRARDDAEICEIVRRDDASERVLWSEPRRGVCPYVRCALASPARCVLVRIGADLTVQRFDVATGGTTGEALRRAAGPRPLVDLSPDGTSVAWAPPREVARAVWLLDVDSGSFREVAPRGTLAPRSVTWHPRGDGWIVAGVEEGQHVVARMQLDGTYDVLLREGPETGSLTFQGAFVSSDGRSLVLDVVRERLDVFALEGVGALGATDDAR